jgi:hypothetical protein
MSGARSRRKGAAFERELVGVPRGHAGREHPSRPSVPHGRGSSDVDCPVFWPEAKPASSRSPGGAAQATDAAPPGRIPIAIIRDDRAEPFVALSLDDFLEFVAEWWARRDK